jgi:hypothetical protein
MQLALTVFRDGDPGVAGRMAWSPFSTIRRLIGNSLFNEVGPEASNQRNVFIREFNSTRSNSEKFNTITKIATMHANALTSEGSTTEVAEVDDIGHSADNFAISLWGEILYGNPNYHVDGRVLSLSEIVLTLASDPWRSVWYSFHLFLKLVAPGQPTRSEAKLRARVDKVVERSIGILEEYERNNPDAPLKTIRNLSIMTAAGRSGPLSKIASEFTNLNVFGSFSSLVLKELKLTGSRWSSQHRVDCYLVVHRARQASRVPGKAYGRNQLCRHHQFYER